MLNKFRAANEGKLEASERKDIGILAAKATGFRDQNNSFIKTFSRLFEETNVKLTKKINDLLGEQSAFRKADRALHKEYFERLVESSYWC